MTTISASRSGIAVTPFEGMLLRAASALDRFVSARLELRGGAAYRRARRDPCCRRGRSRCRPGARRDRHDPAMTDAIDTDAATDAADVTVSGTAAAGRARRVPLGRDFGKLWTAAAFSNLADGLGRTAVPLIATTLTRDPLMISAIGALAFLPWLVFGLPAGMLVDRFDRRIIMAIANGIRFGVALWLAILTATGQISLWTLFAGHLDLRTRRDALRQRDERRHPRRGDPPAARPRERQDAGRSGHGRQLHRDPDRRRAVRRRARPAAVDHVRRLPGPGRPRAAAAAVRRPTAARSPPGARSRRPRHRGLRGRTRADRHAARPAEGARPRGDRLPLEQPLPSRDGAVHLAGGVGLLVRAGEHDPLLPRRAAASPPPRSDSSPRASGWGPSSVRSSHRRSSPGSVEAG